MVLNKFFTPQSSRKHRILTNDVSVDYGLIDPVGSIMRLNQEIVNTEDTRKPAPLKRISSYESLNFQRISNGKSVLTGIKDKGVVTSSQQRHKNSKSKLSRFLNTKTSDDNITENNNNVAEPGKPNPISLFQKLKRSSSTPTSNKNVKEIVDFNKGKTLELSSPAQKFPGMKSPIMKRQLSSSAKDKVKSYDILKAIQASNCKRVKTLLRRKIYNVTPSEEISFLNEAAFSGCTKCLKMLLKSGCSVNGKDLSNWTPLHAAVLGEEINAVKFLIENDASVNALSSDGWSPLHLAVSSGNIYIVHELINNGGDPLLCKDNRMTPFQFAINLQRKLVLDYFLQLPCFLVNP